MRNQSTATDFGSLEGDLSTLSRVGAPGTLLPAVMARTGLIDSYFPLDTPIGSVFVAYNARGISAVMPAEDGSAFERVFRDRMGRPAVPAAELPRALKRSVIEHLQGKRRDLRFDLHGLAEFEQAVLRKALEIPRGEVRPYAWIAREIGRARAARAVGTALANNPIPLLIPCHRVVRSDGSFGQYGLGPANKRGILEAEGVDPAELEELTRRGIRYVGSDTTGIYCFPTCRHARRITPGHRHLFHSEGEAAAAGYGPCKVCRPAAIPA